MQQPRDFSMQGAVDLGARATAAKRKQQVAQSPGGASGVVIEVTDETFNDDVVARSRSVPVIMDLWADWCGPCKQLGPVLEKLAVEADGAWVLAKVDIDANPQLRNALQVQSIPMVVAVIAGELVDGFLGALPEAEVREWIGQIMQVAAQIGLPGGAAADAQQAGQDVEQAGQDGEQPAAAGGPAAAGLRPAAAGDPLGDPGFAAAQKAMDIGDLNGAAQALENILATTPGHPVAVAWLAQVDLFRRVQGYDPELVRKEAAARPDDPEAQGRAADLELAAGEIDAAFGRLLGVVGRTTGAGRDQARKHLLGVFEALSPRGPRVAKARAKLSSLLF